MADTSGSSPVANWLEKLKTYVKSQKGVILAAEILMSFITLICYASSVYGGYIVGVACEMVFSIIFFVIFMMGIDKQFDRIHWPWTDLFRAVTGAVFYLVSSLICVTTGYGDKLRVAGGVFGLFAALLYAFDTYTIYLQIRSIRQNREALTGNGV